MAAEEVPDGTTVRKTRLKDFMSGSGHTHTESDITDLDHLAILTAIVIYDGEVVTYNGEVVTYTG